MYVPNVKLEPRLKRRYFELVSSHLQTAQALANGIHSLPDVTTPFAAAQAAWRFLKNPRVSLPILAEPLIDAGRSEAAQACGKYLLVAHDWSQVVYKNHTSKKDRLVLSSNGLPEGYELQTALLIDDQQGNPLAPAVVGLKAANGAHYSYTDTVQPHQSKLDELELTMTFLDMSDLKFPLVHIIDAEADSVFHYRRWNNWGVFGKHLFLVRADDRLVEYLGQEQKCSAIRETLRNDGQFSKTRQIEYQGKKAWQWVAHVDVRLTRPACLNRPEEKKRRIVPGEPLDLRLVIAEVRDEAGNVLAVWYLLTNVPADVAAETIALWYYWRWRIESFFKLLKSAGMQLENWQQETAQAIIRRLLIASMACVTVWRLARSQHPQAEPLKKLLMKLSGRQTKRSKPYTLPALLSGMWVLLAMLEVRKLYSPDELDQLINLALAHLKPP